MRQWEERGYGQGRKKKKTKDVAKQFEKKLGRLERVEKPWSPWRLELELVPTRRAGDVVARLEQAVVENGTASGSGPWISRSETGSGSRSWDATERASRRSCTR